MAQPAQKASIISEQLTKYLAERTKLDDVSFRRCLREIEGLKDYASEHYLKALAYGAYGKVDEAIAYFEGSLQNFSNDVVAKNFIVFLSDYGTLGKSFETSIKLAERYVSPFIYLHAYENAIFVGEMSVAEKYYNAYAKVLGEEEAAKMPNKYHEVASDVDAFMQLANLTSLEYKLLFQNITSIMDENKVQPSRMKFYNVTEEKLNAIVVMINTNDTNLIADMNIELAFLIAENDCFMQKPFTVWFECEEVSEELNSTSDGNLITRGGAHAG